MEMTGPLLEHHTVCPFQGSDAALTQYKGSDLVGSL